MSRLARKILRRHIERIFLGGKIGEFENLTSTMVDRVAASTFHVTGVATCTGSSSSTTLQLDY